jgi:hypothetical protein
MKRCLTLFGCFLLFLCPAVVAAAQSADDADQATQAEPEVANELAADEGQKQPDLTLEQKLAQLELPDNPTRTQCEAFVNQLRGFRINDVGAELSKRANQKMRSIPVEHIGVLTQLLAENGATEYSIREVLEQFDPESYRKLVVDGFAEDPSLILLIARNGWYQDVKKELTAKLESGFLAPPRMGPIWFQAFVEVAEPEHHELLHKRTLNYNDLRWKLYLLDTLEGYDFARTVNALWANLTPKEREQGSYNIDYVLQPYAIRNGNIDALAYAIEKLINPYGGMTSTNYNTAVRIIITPEILVRRHLDFRGTHHEIAAWFNANRDELVFDTFTQRFQLPEDF